ncbi:N-methylglutamate synthase subunit B [Stella humosa]|uniref:N-methylglutamate synthase subunit B n=1 Tax=Stella humosa TaxID=94 RepID=A0A3N1LHR4_9PROT|nr:protein glxC [Stella humosa]ROP90892.1 N-methylglutamate synthase subunit B [Stella humosa]BBK34759.1 protein glxC [Stella humosa]
MITVDLEAATVRELNQRLHDLPPDTNETAWTIVNPGGRHALLAGLTQPVSITVEGHVGYYCAGMNEAADIVIDGHAGVGVAENIMSGTVRVRGNASQAAGASGHGGLLVVEGDASARCGISMKGVDIVVGGSVGHMSAFMAQAGRLVVCGDAGGDLGDSLYEAVIYVQGQVASLGADCEEQPMEDADRAAVADLLARAGIAGDPARFRRYGSARRLYHFHVDHADAY